MKQRLKTDARSSACLKIFIIISIVGLRRSSFVCGKLINLLLLCKKLRTPLEKERAVQVRKARRRRFATATLSCMRISLTSACVRLRPAPERNREEIRIWSVGGLVRTFLRFRLLPALLLGSQSENQQQPTVRPPCAW
ncbi:hypothetical protein L596_005724 [Steinernema carpocapsae]|uniref:Uncharacterized protein n=1 Tax=Steinernema carpocapsae TaxID=34508 RepID=A0A4U8V168_STECR|nr:hypothetical protein L596_005724 [Steinernema carpocapsae]